MAGAFVSPPPRSSISLAKRLERWASSALQSVTIIFLQVYCTVLYSYKTTVHRPWLRLGNVDTHGRVLITMRVVTFLPHKRRKAAFGLGLILAMPGHRLHAALRSLAICDALWIARKSWTAVVESQNNRDFSGIITWHLSEDLPVDRRGFHQSGRHFYFFRKPQHVSPSRYWSLRPPIRLAT